MKNLILKLLYIVACHLGIFKIFFYIQKKRQTIVTYHNVISDHLFDSKLLHLGVSCCESSFVMQLDVINSHFKIVSEIGIAGSCIISFDDGHKNLIKIAVPHLNTRNIRGLFFIPASFFESESVLWVDRVLMWISYAPTGKYIILGEEVIIDETKQSRIFLWSFMYDIILSNYSLLNNIMRELNFQYSFDILESIIDKTIYEDCFKGMNPSELETMKKMGHSLGCHSFKHDILSLLNEEQLEEDFSKCKVHLQKYNSSLYSYPFGGKSEVSVEVMKACQKHHYSAAFLNYLPEVEDSFSIGRISLDNLNNKYFIKARLCGFEQFLKSILRVNFKDPNY